MQCVRQAEHGIWIARKVLDQVDDDFKKITGKSRREVGSKAGFTLTYSAEQKELMDYSLVFDEQGVVVMFNRFDKVAGCSDLLVMPNGMTYEGDLRQYQVDTALHWTGFLIYREFCTPDVVFNP